MMPDRGNFKTELISNDMPIRSTHIGSYRWHIHNYYLFYIILIKLRKMERYHKYYNNKYKYG